MCADFKHLAWDLHAKYQPWGYGVTLLCLSCELISKNNQSESKAMSLARSLRQRFRSDSKSEGQEDARQRTSSDEVT